MSYFNNTTVSPIVDKDYYTGRQITSLALPNINMSGTANIAKE